MNKNKELKKRLELELDGLKTIATHYSRDTYEVKDKDGIIHNHFTNEDSAKFFALVNDMDYNKIVTGNKKIKKHIMKRVERIENLIQEYLEE